MRIFSEEAEDLADRHARLRSWRAGGFLDAAGYQKAAASLPTEPARAAWALRVLLFGFGALAVGAFWGIGAVGLRGFQAVDLWSLFAAGAAIAAAETAIARLNLRRFGAEEAAVCAAVFLAALGASGLLQPDHSTYNRYRETLLAAALAAFSAAAYFRYGYRLAALGGSLALGWCVARFGWGDDATRVLLALLYCALLAAASFWPDLPRRERERLELVRFLLALAVPLCLNLRLERAFSGAASTPAAGAFATATLAAIFVFPAIWLAWGIRDRSRWMVWAGAIGLLVAQCSIKPYLGLARHSWDPAVLGVELVALALILKRRLDSGPARRRGPWSSEAYDGPVPAGALNLLAGVAAASPATAPSGHGAEKFKGGGGSFGGGGASGGF